MAPIRIALIGLSSQAKTSWAAEGHLPYLLSPRGKSHYEIVALLNSSLAAAEIARNDFGLPSTVKTYGDPAALAQDPDVDLVVCSTRVDTHYETTRPSIKSGKAIYLEWPVAESHVRAAELANTARQPQSQNNNSIIGLQGRLSPVVLKLKSILGSGEIGSVLSSNIHAFGSLLPNDVLPEGLAYFTQRGVGGNPVTIAYAHMIDYVHEVLGEFEGFESQMQIQRRAIGITGGTASTIKSDVPDLVVVHGRLVPRAWNDDAGASGGGGGGIAIAKDAILSVMFRHGQPFKGSPGFVWTINGEKGEVRVTSPAGPYLQSDSYGEPIVIEIHRHGSDEVGIVEWDWEDWQKELPVRARLVGANYERYAMWVESGKRESIPGELKWPTVQDGLVRHGELRTLFEQFDARV